MKLGFGEMFNKIKKDAIVTTAVLGGTAIGALNVQGGEVANPSSPDKKLNTTEMSANLEKEGMYIDNTAEKNKVSLELEKNEKEIKALASAIKNKFYSYSYANEKLKEIMKYKFQTIEIAEEYLSDVFNPKYANLGTFFNDGSSKGFPDLVKLNTLLNNHTTISNKLQELQELNRLADCYAPVVLEPAIRGAKEEERSTHGTVPPYIPETYKMANNEEQEEIGEEKENEIKTSKSKKSQTASRVNKRKGGGRDCYRCGPPGGEIWR